MVHLDHLIICYLLLASILLLLYKSSDNATVFLPDIDALEQEEYPVACQFVDVVTYGHDRLSSEINFIQMEFYNLFFFNSIEIRC